MTIREIQQALYELGYNLGLAGVDGINGRATKNAMLAFQRDSGLRPDGIVGKNTRAALKGASNAPEIDDDVAHCLTVKDLEGLVGVHPKQVAIVKRASVIAKERGCPFRVGEGVRTYQRQKNLWAKGRTAPGPKVTWTMNSKHMIQECGYGVAVDLYPVPLDWNDRDSFVKVGECMSQASGELGYETRWGYDWDDDGVLNERGEYDGPHHELADWEY